MELNVQSQLAYLRGLSAFDEGQKVMEKVSPRRRRYFNQPDDVAAINLFKEAYTALQLAFEADLPEEQRQLGIEMMASMSQEFSVRLMVSGLEASYWNTLMVELNSQNEYDEIRERLQSPVFILAQLRWKIRQYQLRQALARVGRKLAALERQIAFVDFPRARNRNWAP